MTASMGTQDKRPAAPDEARGNTGGIAMTGWSTGPQTGCRREPACPPDSAIAVEPTSKARATVMAERVRRLEQEIRDCRLCESAFLSTATAHRPRPVPWLSSEAPILIAAQAPGVRVHRSGRPFTDPSGDRLRKWLGVGETEFYDRKKFAILPMAFCFPGTNDAGSDLPPPRICAATWRTRALAAMPRFRLIILVGGPALRWHLGDGVGTVTETVRDWRRFPPGIIPLPHPSWRNNAWIRRHSWFERELLPELAAQVASILGD